eukprot:scaffold71450_cov17-Tisochrysis_lutea.AAC.1
MKLTGKLDGKLAVQPKLELLKLVECVLSKTRPTSGQDNGMKASLFDAGSDSTAYSVVLLFMFMFLRLFSAILSNAFWSIPCISTQMKRTVFQYLYTQNHAVRFKISTSLICPLP